MPQLTMSCLCCTLSDSIALLRAEQRHGNAQTDVHQLVLWSRLLRAPALGCERCSVADTGVCRSAIASCAHWVPANLRVFRKGSWSRTHTHAYACVLAKSSRDSRMLRRISPRTALLLVWCFEPAHAHVPRIFKGAGKVLNSCLACVQATKATRVMKVLFFYRNL